MLAHHWLLLPRGLLHLKDNCHWLKFIGMLCISRANIKSLWTINQVVDLDLLCLLSESMQLSILIGSCATTLTNFQRSKHK